MYEAAEKAGVLHYLNHNYRRTPAIAYAKQLIDEGKIGQIFHWRGAYLQDWITDPNFPLTWHLQSKFAGAGPHYDLNSHSVDLARYLIGEVSSVSAMLKTFVTERPFTGERMPAPSSPVLQPPKKGRSQLMMLPLWLSNSRTALLDLLNPAALQAAERISIILKSTVAKEALHLISSE